MVSASCASRRAVWRVAQVTKGSAGRSLSVVRRAGRTGALRRSSRLNAGSFGLLRVAQIHVARRASSSVHHARCAGSLARCANAKSI
ncbi:hypothetical protein A2U01_0046446 [Trifolium medium]|uniref:Uncharacterized protein n=1 Tax=Trifolium medium TaxID=97028 RepID=A0A392QNZ1_9FABA|nr:hypothetical protein [Trifolium medium]